MSTADALLGRLPPTTLVVGKGGVGKTTCAAALALRASLHARTLVLSTDPARALPTVLEHPVESSPTRLPGANALSAQVLDAAELRGAFLERWGTVLRTILDRGTYLDDADIGPLVDTALPGSDEVFSALALARLVRGPSEFDRIFVDTAPTGHTLRLLELPRTFRALVRLLDAMQEKHRFMVRTLTRSYRLDDADAFLAEMGTLAAALDDTLRDPSRCGALMVTNGQHLVLNETRRYFAALQESHVTVAAVIWNGVEGDVPLLDLDDTQGIQAAHYTVPRLEHWPVGPGGLERWLAAMRPARAGARPHQGRRAPAKASREKNGPASDSTHDRIMALLRPVTIVAGKGGVGKTTVALALALHASERARTLVVSTDPAPSLADALAQEIPDADTPVTGVERLLARQMDASAAFARFRAEYQTRVDALFESLLARGMSMAHDRAITRDLLSLAPPGVDEVHALSLLADALFKDHYDSVIVDPAPTGHLLRLLEMPTVALAWTHQLMRLMLKYKDVAGLGETARELLEFSRSLRALAELLQNADRCAVVLVTLDEPVVLAETERLGREVAARGVAVSGVVRNRAREGAALPVPEAPVHFEAPVVDPPPIGIAALRRWTDSWR